MQVFRRIKIDVSSISDAPLRKKYGRTPNFVIIAPNADIVGSIVGKSATSRVMLATELGSGAPVAPHDTP